MTNLIGFRKIWILLFWGFIGEILIILGAYGLGKSSIKCPQIQSDPLSLSSIAAYIDICEYSEKLGTIEEIRMTAENQYNHDNLRVTQFFSTLKCTLAQLDSLRDSINSRNIPNNPTIKNAYHEILQEIDAEFTFEKVTVGGMYIEGQRGKIIDSVVDTAKANDKVFQLIEKILPGIWDARWHLRDEKK